MGEKGILDRIRSFLKCIDLSALGLPDAYSMTLNERISEFQGKCQVDWGVARKCLNLFCRTLHNVYLRTEYGLADFEPYLEVPLILRWSRTEEEDPALPSKTVKGLTPDDSSKFQAAAQRIADREGTYRVHLDIVYWRGGN